jgi:hypothetical protein
MPGSRSRLRWLALVPLAGFALIVYAVIALFLTDFQ